MRETFFYTLEETNIDNGKLYRVKKGSIIHILCGSKLINQTVRVFSNIPPKDKLASGVNFIRNKYHEYSWVNCSKLKNDPFDKYVEIECSSAGSFEFYFTFCGENGGGPKDHAKGGAYIIVEPELKFENGQVLDLNSIQMQTVITKLLGPFDEWEQRLLVSKESGYNMIHFTPIEELSRQSNSSYSLRDLTKLNADASVNGKYTKADLDVLINKMYKEWNMFSIADLVYNHLSNDSPFLQKCPQASYNLENCPYLRPAFVLDRIFYHLAIDIEKGVYESIGIPSDTMTPEVLEKVKDLLFNMLLPKYKIEEFHCLDIEKVVGELNRLALNIVNKKEPRVSTADDDVLDLWAKLSIVQDPLHKRLNSTIDFSMAKKIIEKEIDLIVSSGPMSNAEIQQQLIVVFDKFKSHFKFLNECKTDIVNGWLKEAINNLILTVQYHFFAHDGPKHKSVTKETPLVTTYFYFSYNDASVEEDESIVFGETNGRHIMAHNGWVMNQDPLVNFCSPGTLVYIKRELIAWGDSVKLNYGNKPEDSPELWEYMGEYTRSVARTFHGIRLDNCHNTPLHVAQHYIDMARSIRPDLFVMAELFTNSAETDNIFVSKLGITSLIRESMNAWTSRELGRLLHRFGGDPVGSFFQPSHKPLKETIAHAVFFDVTHDNKSLIRAHTVYDALPRSALSLMCRCAYGSTRGFDELVPHEIHVVNEKRLYARWNHGNGNNIKLTHEEKLLDYETHMIKAKSALNKLHLEMGNNGYNQIYIDQLNDEVIAVTRHNPETHKSVVLIARTCFHFPVDLKANELKHFNIPAKLTNIFMEAKLVEKIPNYIHKTNDNYINGLENFELNCQENLSYDDINKSIFVSHIDVQADETTIYFKDFPPGAVFGFHTSISEALHEKITKLREKISTLHSDEYEIDQIIKRLTFDDLNLLLFRCAEEEIDEQVFSSVYNIPNYGPLTFCGLQGFMNVLQKVRLYNDLGHPIFENLRQGNWMMEYIVRRLKSQAIQPRRSALMELAEWLESLFDLVFEIPRYLIPAYFDSIITSLYVKALNRCYSIMSLSNNKALEINFIEDGSSFIQSLALPSIQLVGISKSALLPNTLVDGSSSQALLSIAAGLPHFCHGIMRNWGRDTFIALKGLLLLTNRKEDAKNIILTFASTLRHGLIPNLLGEGKCARYNARDAIWWWLKGIKDYTECVENGYQILNEEVYRLYPTDDAPYPVHDIPTDAPKQKLKDIIQEAMTVHINGLSFTERNAGPAIDEHMKPEGFHNTIGVNLYTGFVFGGNKYNCGTWMDKMGSSAKAGNKGIPSTPRDGSAIELVGLCRCVLEWLIKMNSCGYYEYDGVKLEVEHAIKHNLATYTWKEWANRIDKNFENSFWIDRSSTESNLINIREIYKDTLNSSTAWADYQMRPNFLIALCLAPQMIDPEHARRALLQCKQYLLNGPNSIGIKTLSENDYTYCGTYDNSDDSADPRVAQGANYHQGPEWLWPIGYYFRALLLYSLPSDRENVIKHIQSYFAKYYDYIRASDWRSLPELTNQNGEFCIFSCPSQAWTIASLLEVCYELEKF